MALALFQATVAIMILLRGDLVAPALLVGGGFAQPVPRAAAEPSPTWPWPPSNSSSLSPTDDTANPPVLTVVAM